MGIRKALPRGWSGRDGKGEYGNKEGASAEMERKGNGRDDKGKGGKLKMGEAG